MKRKSTGSTAEDRMEKALMTVAGGALSLAVSFLTVPAFGAYLGYTMATAAATGKAAAIGAGALGLIVGGIAAVPAAGVIFGVGAATIGVISLGARGIGAAGRGIANIFKSKGPENAPAKPVLSGVESRGGIKVKSASNEFEKTSKPAEPKTAAKKSAPKTANTPKV